jgi:hypothetical protein
MTVKDNETHRPFDEPGGSGFAEFGDVQNRLRQLEEEISSVKSILREILDKL